MKYIEPLLVKILGTQSIFMFKNFGDNLADMQLIAYAIRKSSSFCVLFGLIINTHVFLQWKNERGITIIIAFQNFLDESAVKPI